MQTITHVRRTLKDLIESPLAMAVFVLVVLALVGLMPLPG
jgi:hypothetical protein